MSPGLTGNIKLESGRRSSLQLDLMKFVAETRLVSVDIIYLLRYIHTISTYFFLPCTHLVCTNQTFILKNIVWKEMLINRIRNISYLE